MPENLQPYSKRFCDLAYEVAYCSPESPETTVALRKLLEAKDAAVRAAIPKKKTAEFKIETPKGVVFRKINSNVTASDLVNLHTGERVEQKDAK